MKTRQDPEKWDDDDTLRLINLAREGRGVVETGKIMRRSQASLCTKASRICLHIKESKSAPDFDPAKQKARRCMPCRGWMASEWIGQRICEECKKTYEYRSA